YDTTVTKCFSVHPDVPSINGTLQLLSSNCTVVSFKASGTNLTNPQYCLYNASSVLVECNSTGLFSNEPYGSYCVQIANGCGDTSFRVCQTFSPVHGL